MILRQNRKKAILLHKCYIQIRTRRHSQKTAVHSALDNPLLYLAVISQKQLIVYVRIIFLKCLDYIRQQTEFYLFVTCGDKPFRSKDFSAALGISRVSFAPAELMEEMLGTKIGAATFFSALSDTERKVRFVIDKAVLGEKYYGCSDGTTTGYMKLLCSDCSKILKKHRP